MILRSALQQQADTGAAQQQVVEVQDQFRIAGKRQLRPQGVAGTDAGAAQLFQQ
ncbi:hypothetical protein D9M73_279030 [compost metagenome]